MMLLLRNMKIFSISIERCRCFLHLTLKINFHCFLTQSNASQAVVTHWWYEAVLSLCSSVSAAWQNLSEVIAPSLFLVKQNLGLDFFPLFILVVILQISVFCNKLFCLWKVVKHPGKVALVHCRGYAYLGKILSLLCTTGNRYGWSWVRNLQFALKPKRLSEISAMLVVFFPFKFRKNTCFLGHWNALW